jgi:hypothetical protein
MLSEEAKLILNLWIIFIQERMYILTYHIGVR